MTDYRSDTVTKPGPGMLQAMLSADVGDDVFGDDPTINKLQEMTAEMFGMEAGIFCPSGTMTNQIAIKCHTQPGDELICDHLSHVYIYEGGGIAFNSGCQVKPVIGDRGRITATDVLNNINPDDDHKARTRIVSLENTANRGGGSCYELPEIHKIKDVCSSNGLIMHLDGARLFHALTATNQSPKEYGEIFDSISICLSKGLGAPVGSVLLGKKDFIKKARRVRKVLGGGMRQAGYLAAAGIYALENNIERLETDHIHAKQIAEALLKKDFVGKMFPVETNIILFEVKGEYSGPSLGEAFLKNDIKVSVLNQSWVRIVVHLDIKEEMVKDTIETIEIL